MGTEIKKKQGSNKVSAFFDAIYKAMKSHPYLTLAFLCAVTVLFPCPNHAPFAIYFAVSYNIRGNASLVCKLNVINNPPNL